MGCLSCGEEPFPFHSRVVGGGGGKELCCLCLLKVCCVPQDMMIGHGLINQGGEKIKMERNGLRKLQRQRVCMCALSQQGE